MNGRVLVVHDVAAMRELIAQTLEAEGYTAIGVESGRLAAELMEADPVQVIVTDERLVAECAEDFRRIRERTPRVVIVALAVPTRRRRVADSVKAVHCTVEKPPADRSLVRAIQWAMKVSDS